MTAITMATVVVHMNNASRRATVKQVLQIDTIPPHVEVIDINTWRCVVIGYFLDLLSLIEQFLDVPEFAVVGNLLQPCTVHCCS